MAMLRSQALAKEKTSAYSVVQGLGGAAPFLNMAARTRMHPWTHEYADANDEGSSPADRHGDVGASR